MALQQRLGVAADGVFGSKTDAAVRSFQRGHGLAVDGIVGARTWAALGVPASASAASSAANPRLITEIIVHCEATPEGEDFTPEQVSASHKARHFSPYTRNGRTWYIGYHYVIQLDGRVIACRPESMKGCHLLDCTEREPPTSRTRRARKKAASATTAKEDTETIKDPDNE